jgi:hypothetical protein
MKFPIGRGEREVASQTHSSAPVCSPAEQRAQGYHLCPRRVSVVHARVKRSTVKGKIGSTARDTGMRQTDRQDREGRAQYWYLLC